MNIFALDHDPKQCAEWHVNKHVIKQILEYSQLLSTAHRILDGTPRNELSQAGRRITRWELPDSRESELYKATHINHPSAVWARESASNYEWLQNLLSLLCAEYTYRYGKVHKCQSSGLVDALKTLPNNIKDKGLTPVLCAMPDEYKVPGDHVESYRNYYRYGKGRMLSWTGKIAGRSTPEWL